MDENTEFMVYQITARADGKFSVMAREVDPTGEKKKLRRETATVTDPTSFYVGQKVRVTLDDAS